MSAEEPSQIGTGESEKPEELQRMSLLEHLEELRTRILRALGVILVGFFVCFAFAEDIYEVLAIPVKEFQDKLVFLKITDPFFIYMKVALVASVFLTSPYLLSQVWGFVAPGLYRREKLWAIPFVLCGSMFFLAGGLFGYLVAFPFALDFLINLGDNFEPMLTANEYFNVLIAILLGLGVMFQLPIMIFLLSQMGVVTPRFLMKNFRWAVLIIFVVAAIITPTPDILNLMIVAGPTILLYLVGVGAAYIARGRKSKREASADASA